MGMPEQIMLFVASIFKGITINKKVRLDHESLRYPETRILSSFEYIVTLTKQSFFKAISVVH